MRLVVANGNLYMGGAFTTPRPYMAELNATTNTYIRDVASPSVRRRGSGARHRHRAGPGSSRAASSSAPPDPGCDGRIGIGAVNTTDGAFVAFAYHGPPTFVPPPASRIAHSR